MAKFSVEIKEVLTYYVTVEADDHDDAWDVAMNTRKFCESDYDDNDTECVEIDEVPDEWEVTE